MVLSELQLSELQQYYCRCRHHARDLSPFHSSRGSYFGEIMGLLIAEWEQFYWEQQSRTRSRLGEQSTATLLAYRVLAHCFHLLVCSLFFPLLSSVLPFLPAIFSPSHLIWPYIKFHSIFWPSFSKRSSLKSHYDSFEPGDISCVCLFSLTVAFLFFPFLCLLSFSQNTKAAICALFQNKCYLLNRVSLLFLRLSFCQGTQFRITPQGQLNRRDTDWWEPSHRAKHWRLLLPYFFRKCSNPITVCGVFC